MGSRIQRLRSAIPAVLMTGVFPALLVIAASSQAYADISYSSLERLAGAGGDRYETMSDIIETAYPADETSEWAIIASGENFPDALAASSLVGALDCPLITTENEALTSNAKDQLERLGVKNVYILGDNKTITDGVEKEIEALGISTDRLSGYDRVGTALAIAEKTRSLDSSSDTCIVAKSNNYPDALAISAWAAHTSSPIFFATDGTLDSQTAKAIKEGRYSKVVVLGLSPDEKDANGNAKDPSGISDDAVSGLGLFAFRIAGDDRYETAASIVDWETSDKEYEDPRIAPAPEDLLSFDGAAIATGDKFPDALASVSLTSVRGSVLILAADNARTEYMANTVIAENASSIESAYVLGDADSVSSKVFGWFSQALKTVVSGEDKPSGEEPDGSEDPEPIDPSTDTSATGDPSEDDPSGEDPSDDNPAIDNPSEDTPATDDPSGEDPVTDQPSEDDPATDTPSEGGSAGDGPSTESGSEAR